MEKITKKNRLKIWFKDNPPIVSIGRRTSSNLTKFINSRLTHLYTKSFSKTQEEKKITSVVEKSDVEKGVVLCYKSSIIM